jgi:hypothetical protein
MANQQRARRLSGASPGVVKRWLVRLGLLAAVMLTMLLLVIGFAFRLPASVLDPIVSAISHDAVRLVRPSGQVRSGRAELWVRDAARREWQPWMPIDWTLSPDWRDGDLGLLLDSNVGTVRLDRSGLSLSDLQVSLPPNLLLAGINHPLAKAPWRGDIDVTSSRLDCAWAGMRQFPSCDGLARLHWRGMGSAILPLQEIGSYAALIDAQSRNGGSWRADVETESGVVTLTGFAEVVKGAVTYSLRIKGEGHMMEGLDKIAGPAFKKQGNTGEFIFEGTP